MPEANPLPSSSSWTISDLKAGWAAGLPKLQSSIHSSRPGNILETTSYIPMRDGYMSRIIVLKLSNSTMTAEQAAGLPVHVMFCGAGHYVSHPESAVPLLCQLVPKYKIIRVAL